METFRSVQEFRYYRGDEARMFAHESEREIAALLDAAGIPWLYEPRTFVLEEEDGAIVEGFTPDFYLPDADVYLECTTAKRSLTTRKNGKIRKLRARGEMVTVLYRRDMERLIRRYGSVERYANGCGVASILGIETRAIVLNGDG